MKSCSRYFWSSISTIAMLLCCISCVRTGVRSTIKEFEFKDLDVEYYVYNKPHEGNWSSDYIGKESPYITNFEQYGDYINNANFYDNLTIYFTPNDFDFDIKRRSLKVEYYIYDENFMPFDSQLLFKKGDTLRDGSIATADIYDRQGSPYILESQYKEWNGNEINLHFNNFNSFHPTYLELELQAFWYYREEASSNTAITWSSFFVAFFFLEQNN